MRHVAEIRKKLGIRTIFNLVGPLTNPANVKRHLIGVYDLEWLGPMGEVLRALGSEAAWLTHGHDGMDEITTTAPTDVVELRGGFVRHFALAPEDFGLPGRAKLENLERAAMRPITRRSLQSFCKAAGALSRYRAAQCRRGFSRRR